MESTDEQKAIIEGFQRGEPILVSALAGSGKTTTLRLLAEAYPLKRGLYLAYNKAMQLDAQKVFPSHVVCKTVHSLAYQHVGHQYADKLSRKLRTADVVDRLKIFDLKEKKLYASNLFIAASAMKIVQNFCFSPSDEIMPHHYSHFHVEVLKNRYDKLTFDPQNILDPKTFLERFVHESFEYAKELWEEMISLNHRTLPSSHDAYLKLYQLSKPKISRFDYIMLDEAQDANPAILDIFEIQDIQKIYVGDTHQQIYGYRGTRDAMSHVSGHHFYLTQSFRFGSRIAEIANKVLDKNHSAQRIRGYDVIPSVIGEVKKDRPYTFIARSTAGLFNEILTLIEQNKKISYVGDIKQALILLESAYFLYKDQVSYIKDSDIKRFPRWNLLKSEAIETQDPDLLPLVKFIEKHDTETPKILIHIEERCQFREDDADVIVTTTHKAKGRQWEQVRLNNDFKVGPSEELNILYVAVTRASHVLDLSCVNNFLTKEEVITFDNNMSLSINLSSAECFVC